MSYCIILGNIREEYKEWLKKNRPDDYQKLLKRERPLSLCRNKFNRIFLLKKLMKLVGMK